MIFGSQLVRKSSWYFWLRLALIDQAVPSTWKQLVSRQQESHSEHCHFVRTSRMLPLGFPRLMMSFDLNLDEKRAG